MAEMDAPSSPPWRSGFLSTRGIRLHHVEVGNGERLVLLLHGFPEFHESWRHQIPALGERFRTVALDLPGYGESERPPGGYGIENIVQTIAGAIEALGHQRAHIVGHDWGGALAWALAALRPDRVDRLAILNAPHPAAFPRAILRPSQLRRSWYIFFFQIPYLPEWLLSRRRGSRIAGSIRAGWRSPRPLPVETIDRFRDHFDRPERLRGPIGYYRAIRRIGPGLLKRLARPIETPTLVVWGERDPFLETRLTDEFDRYASPLEKKFLPQAGHWVQQEEPEAVNEALLQFLE